MQAETRSILIKRIGTSKINYHIQDEINFLDVMVERMQRTDVRLRVVPYDAKFLTIGRYYHGCWNNDYSLLLAYCKKMAILLSNGDIPISDARSEIQAIESDFNTHDEENVNILKDILHFVGSAYLCEEIDRRFHDEGEEKHDG